METGRTGGHLFTRRGRGLGVDARVDAHEAVRCIAGPLAESVWRVVSAFVKTPSRSGIESGATDVVDTSTHT